MIHQILRRLKSPASVLALMFFALTSFSGVATATTYTVYIHGKASGGSFTEGINYSDFGYWNSVDGVGPGGPNKRAINWDGKNRIADTNKQVRQGLDCFCTGSNSCHVVVHSAGNLQIGFALANWGTSKRWVYASVPQSDGTVQECTPIGIALAAWGATEGVQQTGWNIKSVTVAAGAAGGSELARPVTYPSAGLNRDLNVTTARSLYDHNQTQGHTFNLHLGAKSDVVPVWIDLVTGIAAGSIALLLPGEDDGAVAYHSSAGRKSSSTFCNTGAIWWNPATWSCTQVNTGTSDKAWDNHSVSTVDTGANYNHSNVKKRAYEASKNFK